MRILFDHLCFWQKYGGVPRYYVELMKRLPTSTYVTTVKFTNNEYLKEIPSIHVRPFLKEYYFRGKARLENEIGKFFSVPYLLKSDFDIYHQTHYDPYAFKFLSSRIKRVTTVHDMNYYAIPEYYPAKVALKRKLEKSLKKVDHIITISQNSQKDICNYLNVPKEKISVIYHGVERNNKTKAVSLPPMPYVLYVGARNKYKNFVKCLEAFSLLREKYRDIFLCCTGIPPTKAELAFLREQRVEDYVKFYQASDEELRFLYQNALFFIFPSLYEGFGMPILEAMINHCPVVLSDTSCFPEIAQDAGLYFNPEDIEDMYDKMCLMVENEELRIGLVAKGNERAKDFSWEKCAAQHLEVYKSLL